MIMEPWSYNSFRSLGKTQGKLSKRSDTDVGQEDLVHVQRCFIRLKSGLCADESRFPTTNLTIHTIKHRTAPMPFFYIPS